MSGLPVFTFSRKPILTILEIFSKPWVEVNKRSDGVSNIFDVVDRISIFSHFCWLHLLYAASSRTVASYSTYILLPTGLILSNCVPCERLLFSKVEWRRSVLYHLKKSVLKDCLIFFWNYELLKRLGRFFGTSLHLAFLYWVDKNDCIIRGSSSSTVMLLLTAWRSAFPYAGFSPSVSDWSIIFIGNRYNASAVFVFPGPCWPKTYGSERSIPGFVWWRCLRAKWLVNSKTYKHYCKVWRSGSKKRKPLS